MKMKRIFSAVLGSAVAMSMLAGCGGGTTATEGGTASSSASTGTGEIYFLNFKPEIAEIYDKVVADYEKETGVKVKVVTAASGTYETTLKSEMAVVQLLQRVAQLVAVQAQELVKFTS